MNLTRSLRLAFGLLLGIHLMMAFGAVVLLARMRPAIQKIIEENAHSLEAGEEMLAILAASGDAPIDEPSATHYRAAYARLAANVTDPREQPVIDDIARDLEGSLAGEARPKHESVALLRQLGAINRDGMVQTDRQAQQLGTAGAWSVVFLALLTFIGGIVALRRLDVRVLDPIEELYAVLDKNRAGDPHRRCRLGLGAATDLAEVMKEVNALLDDRHRQPIARGDVESLGDRAVLLNLLDQREDPTFVVSDAGEIVTANAAGLDALGSDEQLRARLLARVGETDAGDPSQTDPANPSSDLTVTMLAEGRRFLVTLARGA